jgi:opine dehydrogenase
MSALGAAAEVATPAIDALIAIVRNMTGRDFTAEGRTIERLGMSGMGAAEIVRVMNEGFA